MFGLILLQGFRDYFQADEPQKTYLNGFESITSNGDYWIYGSVFQNLYRASSGGALYISATTMRILIDCSVFVNCHSMEEGGAIFLQSSSGESVIDKVCGKDCLGCMRSETYGQFLKCMVGGARNNITQVSLSNCSSLSSRYSIIFIGTGNPVLTFFNSSRNSMFEYNGGDFRNLNSLNINFCTCAHNFASFSIVFGFWSTPQSVNYVNFVNNTQGITDFSLLYKGGYTLQRCYLINNFNSLNKEIVSEGSIIANECYIGAGHSLTSVTVQNSLSDPETHSIAFYYMDNCKPQIIPSIMLKLRNNLIHYVFLAVYPITVLDQ